MIGWLRRLLVAYRNRHDAGLQDTTCRFGTKPRVGTFDGLKASQGWHKAQKQTPTGRAIVAPKKRTTRKPADVTPIRKRANG